MCLEISLRLIPRPYMPIIFCSRLSARIVSRLRINSGSKVELRSLGVSIVMAPEDSGLLCWFYRFYDCQKDVLQYLDGFQVLLLMQSLKSFLVKERKPRLYHTVICPNAIAQGLLLHLLVIELLIFSHFINCVSKLIIN